MNKVEAEILQVLEAYKAAVLAKDVAAFIANYDDDVRVFDLWGVWSYGGLAAWRTTVQNWFGSIGAEHVVVDFSEVRTTIGNDVAALHGFVNYKAVGADGAALHAMDNRLTMVLKRHDDGAWKIVHEHTSAPAANDTAKVILKR
jgi:uncharacterized protein (TIGR02246 family)